MVVKIQASHPHMEGTLSYNQRKVEKGVARVVSAVNLPSAFPGDIRRTFSRYENRNRVTERVSFQLSINPDPGRPEERLTDAEVRDFAAALMDGLGYGSQPYVIYEHADIDRTHYHVVSVRTDWEGKKIRDYREQYRCQRLLKENAQRFHYRVGEGLGRMKQPSPAKGTFDLKAGDIRNQYRSLFHKAMRYRFTTLPQLKAVCSSLGLLLDTRDTPDGPDIVLQGTDRKGVPVSQRIRGRELGEDFHALFESRARACRALPPVSRKERARVAFLVSRALARSRSEDAFRSYLMERGIHASVFRSRSGDIYGATFVDGASRSAMKGSELPGITTAAYREADSRWRLYSLREEADLLSKESSRALTWEDEPLVTPVPSQDESSEELTETVVEEDVVDVALGMASAVLGRKGDFGAASSDDSKVFKKKKKRIVRRIH